MRIAVVTTSWPRSEGDPSGHFVAAETRALTQRSEAGAALDVEVIFPAGEAFGWPGFAARLRESPRRAFAAAAWVERARRRVNAGVFDEVVAHWAVPCAWPIATGSKARLKVISHGGDVRLLTRLPQLVRSRLVRRIAGRAVSWTFVSTALLDSLRASLPPDVAAALDGVARIEACAIEIEAPAPEAIAAKRATFGAPFHVCVARLVPSKRVEAAIDWAIANAVPLVIVGDGPERAPLERHARGDPRIHFVGRTSRAEALAWTAASAGLVQPSRVEGLSTVVREANALGVPVVAI